MASFTTKPQGSVYVGRISSLGQPVVDCKLLPLSKPHEAYSREEIRGGLLFQPRPRRTVTHEYKATSRRSYCSSVA